MSDTAEHLGNPMTVLRKQPRPVTISLSPATHEALRGMAHENERSVSAEIRWALKQYAQRPEMFE